MISVPVTAKQVMERLEENHLRYERMELQDSAFAIIMERGGRVLGPFLGINAPSLLWLNPAFADYSSFKKFLDSGSWNLGGDRNWIAPEVQYLFGDRNRVAETVRIPPQMDPGSYRLESSDGHAFLLSQELVLDAFNINSGQKQLQLAVTIKKAANPLRFLSSCPTLMKDIRYFGYEQQVVLSETHRDNILSELWNLIQLNPGGCIILPISPLFEVTDYVDPKIDKDYLSFHKNALTLRITGECLYKVGFKAAHHFGRLAYLQETDPGNSCLIVRSFYNNPSSFYVEEPWDQVGRWGDSIHIYNDDGRLGGFGELEVHGQTVGCQTGRSSSVDELVLWFYCGEIAKLRKILACLCGADGI